MAETGVGMSADEKHENEVTRLLSEVAAGRDTAVGSLLSLVYDELRGLAGDIFRVQSPGHTLQPTALVHEAFVKLVGAREVAVESRAHFFALAAKAMRQILTDHARRRRAEKRGGNRAQVTLSDVDGVGQAEKLDISVLDDALRRLAAMDERQYKIVELRFLGGLTHEEAAGVLDVSVSTVEREWRMARAWLRRELKEPGET